MAEGQIIRGDRVEVFFAVGVDPLIGTVSNAPHREETHERLGWIVIDDEGAVHSLGTYAYIKKLS